MKKNLLLRIFFSVSIYLLRCADTGLYQPKFNKFLSRNKNTCKVQTGSKELDNSTISCVFSAETPLKLKYRVKLTEYVVRI